MIAAVKDLALTASDVGPNQNAVDFLEACNLLFEQGMLSRRRINNKNSPVLTNIKKGMAFFEQWCPDHEDTGNYLVKKYFFLLFKVKTLVLAVSALFDVNSLFYVSESQTCLKFYASK